jgi:hypothetical protein
MRVACYLKSCSFLAESRQWICWRVSSRQWDVRLVLLPTKSPLLLRFSFHTSVGSYLKLYSNIFCDITPRRPLKVNRHFAATYRFHLQSRICLARYQSESRWHRIRKYCHVWGVPWRIIMGSGLDDWICWHFFTITTNYNSSQSVTD